VLVYPSSAAGNPPYVLHLESAARCLKFAPDGGRVYVGCQDGVVRAFGFSEPLGTLGNEPLAELRPELTARVNCLAISSDGRHLLVGSGDFIEGDGDDRAVNVSARIWTINEDGQYEPGLKLGPLVGAVWSVAFSADGRFCATGTSKLHSSPTFRLTHPISAL
jgi:WD40 repeat protein